MDDARSVLGGDEVGHHDPAGVSVDGDEVEGPLVAEAGQVGAAEFLDDLPAGFVHRAEDGLDPVPAEHDVALHPGPADPDVGHVGADGGGDVGDERPRRRRPHQ